MSRAGSVIARVEAPPETVWALVADVARMAEWSPTCERCEWIDGATGPAAGARFVGHNRVWGRRWSRRCVVIECEPGRAFSFVTLGRGERHETYWRYRFEPEAGGTRVTESYENVAAPLYVKVFRLGPHLRRAYDRALHRSMEETLARVKAAAEAPTA